MALSVEFLHVAKCRAKKTVCHVFDHTMRYRNHFTYTVLAVLVLWAWWANVISVYMRSQSSGDFRSPQKLAVSSQKVVVFSCIFELYQVPAYCLFDNVCGCNYWLPVSVLAWRRFGYKALIFVVGPHQGDYRWQQRKSFWFALDMLSQIGGVQIEHIDSMEKSFRTTAQIMTRLFAGNLITQGNPYVIFSEVNFFPLSQAYLEPIEGHENGVLIISTKSRCCKRFLLNDNVIKLLNSGCMVGMQASTWRQVVGDVTLLKQGASSNAEEDGRGPVVSSKLNISEISSLFEKYVGTRDLNQIKEPADKVILSILLNKWLRSKGDEADGIEKELFTIRQPPHYKKHQYDKAEAEAEEIGGNLFREFPYTAQTITGWSEIYPVVAEIFDPTWLDLTEYWINFTNVVNSEPNINPRTAGYLTSTMLNGVRFFPLIIPTPSNKNKSGVIGSNPEKQEDFQYVAFFDEDED